jgi:glycosyltransferase involved in cell wall biosynthesis
VATGELASFDLVVATVGRVGELDRFLESLERQTHKQFRILLADQNEDERLTAVVASHPELDIMHVRSEIGLSRARNTALEHVSGDVVAFPDDDCLYPENLLQRVARRLGERSDVDGVSGRVVDADGRSSASWKADRAVLDRSNLWNRANSATIFLRRKLLSRVGPFDEQLGLGSGTPWHSAEEIDYLIRAVDAGARIEYDPSLVVEHPQVGDDFSIGYRDGASVGYLLRKHAYPLRTVARMLVRPVGGALVSLTRLDRPRARFHTATLRGRVTGLRAKQAK